MTPAEFVETVRSDNETALSRLGSSKALYAATAGEMDGEVVLATAAAAADAAGETFAAWADDADGAVADSFAAAAEVEERRAETVAAELDGERANEMPAAVAALRELDGAAARVGGYVAWALVTRKATDQFTGFFVGQADPGTAQLFRSFGGDLDGHLERGRELLESVAGDEAEDEDENVDLDTARSAARDVIQAAYDEYTETLEGLGVNPKPVC